MHRTVPLRLCAQDVQYIRMGAYVLPTRTIGQAVRWRLHCHAFGEYSTRRTLCNAPCSAPPSSAGLYQCAQSLMPLFILIPAQHFQCTSLIAIVGTSFFLQRFESARCRTRRCNWSVCKVCGTLARRTMIRSMF